MYLSIPKLQQCSRLCIFIPFFIRHMVTYPCWDWNYTMSDKGATGYTYAYIYIYIYIYIYTYIYMYIYMYIYIYIYIYGSGHETVAVLLPGFAINYNMRKKTGLALVRPMALHRTGPKSPPLQLTNIDVLPIVHQNKLQQWNLDKEYKLFWRGNTFWGWNAKIPMDIRNS